MAYQHFISDRAQGKDVRQVVGGFFTRHLFRSQIAPQIVRPPELAGIKFRIGSIDPLGHSHADDFGHPGPVQQNPARV